MSRRTARVARIPRRALSQVRNVGEWLAAVRRIRSAYQAAHGRRPRLLRPRRYTEKMQWRKAFDLNPLFAILSDKLAVRDYVAARIGEEHLVPMLWSGRRPEDIRFLKLEPPYVLKSTHASGQLAMVWSETDVKIKKLRTAARSWLDDSYGERVDEPGYVPVPRRLMIERTVTAPDGSRPPEVRLFVFDGRVEVVNSVFVEGRRVRNGAFHTPDWKRLDWHFSRVVDRDFPPPQRLDDMIRAAETLGRGIDHVRVDVYDCGDRFYVGELSLYSWSGRAPFEPDDADLLLGACWTVPRPARRAVRSILTRRRVVSAA